MDSRIIGEFIEGQLTQLADSSRKNGAIWRAAFTEEDRKGSSLIESWMKERCFDVYQDAIGNIFGRIEGDEEGIILVGSHKDTVKDGGKYDGAAGVVTAIDAASTLYKALGRPKKTVEVVAMQEEEGSRFVTGYLGSRAMVGKIEPIDFLTPDMDGVTLAEAMKNSGLQTGKIQEAKKKGVESFLELHIEQGSFLESNGYTIGVVESIVGLGVMEVTLKGQQNHAGTTSMNMRKDPLVAAARTIDRMTRAAAGEYDRATLTVGIINAFPGISNVIADKVEFSIDYRAGNAEDLSRLKSQIQSILLGLEGEGFQVKIEEKCFARPVAMDKELMKVIEKAAEKGSFAWTEMNSGAGHDAQILAEKIPTAMIFIPSHNGISHSSLEYTSAEDLGAGFAVLSDVIKELAW